MGTRFKSIVLVAASVAYCREFITLVAHLQRRFIALAVIASAIAGQLRASDESATFGRVGPATGGLGLGVKGLTPPQVPAPYRIPSLSSMASRMGNVPRFHGYSLGVEGLTPPEIPFSYRIPSLSITPPVMGGIHLAQRPGFQLPPLRAPSINGRLPSMPYPAMQELQLELVRQQLPGTMAKPSECGNLGSSGKTSAISDSSLSQANPATQARRALQSKPSLTEKGEGGLAAAGQVTPSHVETDLNRTEAVLRSILMSPVAKGSTQRRDALFKFFADLTPEEAHELYGRLGEQDDALRQRLESRLASDTVTEVLHRLQSMANPGETVSQGETPDNDGGESRLPSLVVQVTRSNSEVRLALAGEDEHGFFGIAGNHSWRMDPMARRYLVYNPAGDLVYTSPIGDWYFEDQTKGETIAVTGSAGPVSSDPRFIDNLIERVGWNAILDEFYLQWNEDGHTRTVSVLGKDLQLEKADIIFSDEQRVYPDKSTAEQNMKMLRSAQPWADRFAATSWGYYKGPRDTVLPTLYCPETMPRFFEAVRLVHEIPKDALADEFIRYYEPIRDFVNPFPVELDSEGKVEGIRPFIPRTPKLHLPSVRPSVWTMPAQKRGRLIEDYLAGTDYRGWWRIGAEQGGTLRLIDFQNGRDVVSLKTLDTMGATWRSRMRQHIDELGRHKITVDVQPANKILDIRVQPGGKPAATELIEYGRERGVTVRVSEF